jgi:hypothetical protein
VDDVPGLKLSRRGLITAVLATPAAGAATLSAAPVAVSMGQLPDPIVARSVAWIAASSEVDAMTLEWQELESQLFDKAKTLRIKTEKACRSRMLEARAMRALDRRIRAGYRSLALSAGEISDMRATSIAGALAKIELGLKVQGPYDWQDHALELAEGGVSELKAMMKVLG